ncbi:hypothetical protein EV182_004508, partial [Spiromyces aspiralis]
PPTAEPSKTPQISLPDTSLDSGSERKRKRSTSDSAGSSPNARVFGDQVSVGLSSWTDCINRKTLLVDKTESLLAVIKGDPSEIILRPRWFGKTLHLRTIEAFFNYSCIVGMRARKQWLFRGMNIHKVDPNFVDEHCGKYPDVRPATLDEFRDSMAQAIFTVTNAWRHAISDTSKVELNDSRDWLNQMKSNMRNNIDDSVKIPAELSSYLSRYCNAQCIVLVDEFDAPVTSAPKEIREEVKRYMRRLLSPLAKNNDNVRKFIMAGIDPVNLDTSGSGLNNCIWYPLHEDSDSSREGASSYQFAFGFTEEEVDALIGRVADKMGLVERQADQLRGAARK